MESKIRVGAIIIKENKLLMVKGKNHKELWTPGGKIEDNESEFDCLKRELKEELNVKVVTHKFFNEYKSKSFYHDYLMINRIYLVTIKGKLIPSMEIEKFIWLTKEDFLQNKHPMIPVIRDVVLPELISKKVW